MWIVFTRNLVKHEPLLLARNPWLHSFLDRGSTIVEYYCSISGQVVQTIETIFWFPPENLAYYVVVNRASKHFFTIFCTIFLLIFPCNAHHSSLEQCRCNSKIAPCHNISSFASLPHSLYPTIQVIACGFLHSITATCLHSILLYHWLCLLIVICINYSWEGKIYLHCWIFPYGVPGFYSTCCWACCCN